MLKYIGLIFIVLTFFGIGYYLSLRLKYRYDFLISFKEFLSVLKINMRYSGSEIYNLVKKSVPDCFNEIFDRGSKDSFNNYWRECIESIPKTYALKKDDYSLLYEFGKLLGTTDIEGQLNHIDLYCELFETNINNSKQELKQKSKLFILLGLFSGITIALLLI